MNNQQNPDDYYHHIPAPLRPRRTIYEQVTLCQVEGVGVDQRADVATVATRSFVVRSKDLPRLFGDVNHSMLMHISDVSGASLSLSVDLKNLRDRTVQINLWGSEAEIEAAEVEIFNVITQGYNDPPAFLPLIHGYVHQCVMTLPIHQVLYLLSEHNLVTLEAQYYTWIDVDASKAWKTDAPVLVDVQILGAGAGEVDATRERIIAIVALAPAAPGGGHAEMGCFGRVIHALNWVWTRVTHAGNWLRDRCC